MTKSVLSIHALASAVLACSACTTLPEGTSAPERTSGVTRATREQAMNARWQNHKLAELVRARGAPRETMTIPGGGNPPGFIGVYERDPESGCVDAFALMDGPEPVIRYYYCR